MTGAGASGVYRWTEAEDALTADWGAEAVANLKADPDDMLEDMHGSADYRAHLVAVMTKRAVAGL